MEVLKMETLDFEKATRLFHKQIGLSTAFGGEFDNYLKSKGVYTKHLASAVEYAIFNIARAWVYNCFTVDTNLQKFIIPNEIPLAFILIEDLDALLGRVGVTQKGLCHALEYLFSLKGVTTTFYIGKVKGKKALRFRVWSGNSFGGVDTRPATLPNYSIYLIKEV